MAAQGGIRAGRAFIEVFLDSSKVQAGLKRIGSRFTAAGASLARVGGAMVGGATALAAPVALATKVYADFDDAMRRVEARSRGTADEMSALRTQAKELGRTTSSTATQIANMMGILAQRGFQRGQIAQIIPNVRNLAQAAGSGEGEADAALAAELVSGALRAWKMDAGESGRIADIFTAAVNSSNFTLQGLIESLKTAAPIAAQYGYSIEDTIATLAGMTNVNIDATSAGVAFRNMILNTSNAAKRAEFNKVMESMGRSTVAFTDAAGDLRAPAIVLDEIGQAMKGLGTAQAGEILEALFGKRTIVGAGAVAASISDSAGGFTELLNILYSVDDTAARTAQTMDAGLGGTFRRVLSAAEGVALAIGESLESALIRLEPYVISALGAFTGFIEGVPEAIPMLAAVAAGIGATGTALIATGAIVGVFGAALSGLGAVAGIVLTPIGAIIAAVGVMSAAVVGSALYEMWQEGAFAEIGSEFSAMASHAKDSFSSIADAIQQGDLQTALDLLKIEFQIQWSKLLDALEDEWKYFMDRLPRHAWNVFKKQNIMLRPFFAEYGNRDELKSSTELADLELRRKMLMDQIEANKTEEEASEAKEKANESTQDAARDIFSSTPYSPLPNPTAVSTLGGLAGDALFAEIERQVNSATMLSRGLEGDELWKSIEADVDREFKKTQMAQSFASVGGFDVAGVQQGLAPSLYDESRKQTNYLREIRDNTDGDDEYGA